MGEEGGKWRSAVEALRAIERGKRWASTREVKALFEVAQDLAPKLLGKIALPSDTPHDLARSLLVEKLDLLVDCQGDSFSYFVGALRNRALSWLRRDKKTEREAEPEEQAIPDHERAHARVDLLAVWARLTPKEQEIISADEVGESRESIALRFKTTRANIDQQISRARSRLKRKGFS